MGRIVITEYMSVDGVVEAPSGQEEFERVGWTDGFSRGPEGDRFKVDETMASDALLLGRGTYEQFAAVWPHVEGEFADYFNSMPKYVVSSTLRDPAWNNTSVLSGNVVHQVTKLKERYERDIVVHGSPQLAQTLIEHDLWTRSTCSSIRSSLVPASASSPRQVRPSNYASLAPKRSETASTSSSTSEQTREPEMNVQKALDDLDVFVGRWSMAASFTPDPADAPRAWTTFEWLPGRRFLIQRWVVDHPEAPDGIAIIGFDPDKAALRQHYFDSRGVARVYEMSFADNVWTLERHAVAPDFSQRFTGRFDERAGTIAGSWERSSDGANWVHDFDLTHRRLPEEEE